MELADLRTYFAFDDLEIDIVEGDVERVIYTGEKLQLIEYRFPANKQLPSHLHEAEEQMGYVVQGKMAFTIGGRERVLEPGDFYHARIGEIHGARTLDEPAVLLDFFAPPRDDLMAASNRWLDASDDEA